jgi:hypothetical protein
VLERLRSGESDGVVVMNVDRFARSVEDGVRIVREIIDRDQVFASCEQRMDPRTPEGKYMLTMWFGQGELFLDQKKAGWWTAKAKALARGVHIGPTPIGYLKVDLHPTKPTHISPADSAARGGPTESGRLISDLTYGPAMTELFKRAASGTEGDSALARWMTERAPRRGGAPWQPSEIRRWLGNRDYLGEVSNGDLPVNPEAHEPLTDPETWERCQKPTGIQRRAHSKFLLSGLVRCAHCRYSMGGFSYGGSGSTPVYRCHRARNGGCAEASVIIAERLEGYIRELALDRLRGLQLEAAGNGVDIEAIDRAYEEAEGELQTFAANLGARRTLGEAGWREALDLRASDRDAKRKARDDAYSRSKLLAVARDVEDLKHDDLRDLLGGMIRHVFVRRRPRGGEVADRVLAIWSDDSRAIDVPGPHRSGPFEPVRW